MANGDCAADVAYLGVVGGWSRSGRTSRVGWREDQARSKIIGYAGQSQKGKSAAKSGETIRDVRLARTEARTPGTDKSTPHVQLLKRARVLHGKVGGRAHKEATHIRQSWPVLCAGDADCHGHRTWLHVERGERDKEEGEEVKNTHDAHKYPE
ncbi:hypothetical protein B0H13DRAFT_1918212 [Mycena leptocephala]|nr:hypothetical protein B0H13DRAFT_1918212 [Mycena leptocephala]